MVVHVLQFPHTEPLRNLNHNRTAVTNSRQSPQAPVAPIGAVACRRAP